MIKFDAFTLATEILIEGEPIVHLSVIKEGKCKVTKSTTGLALEKVIKRVKCHLNSKNMSS